MLTKEARQHIAEVLVFINDIRRDNCTITPVCNPLHIISFCQCAGLQLKPELGQWSWGLISNGKSIDTL
jgi:hypothetical protein